jgi:hypothetical protein
MKKKNARQQKPTSAKDHCNFSESASARYLWALAALQLRPMSYWELDEHVGGNLPDVLADLHAMGFQIPCEQPAPAFGQDELAVESGVFHLTDTDRKLIARLLRARAKGAA